MAGRSIPGMVRSDSFDIAIKAPVLPAETTALARLSRTESIARRIEECRPLRSATEGLISDSTLSSQCTISLTARSLAK